MSSDLSRKFVTLVGAFLFALVILLPAGKAMAQNPGPDAAPVAQALTQNVKEVYFPFNVFNKVVDRSVLDSDAEWLKQNPDAHFWIQAYADIRGDVVYNLVLSYHRAQWIKNYLVQHGVNESQIGFATGWGKLYQVCEQQDEQCFQKNRRGDMLPPDLLAIM